MFDFSDFSGHENLILRLRALITHNKFPQSIIIDGAFGCGKTTLAKTLAKTLLCEKGGDEPCNCCLSCITFDSNNNPDVFFITPSKTRLGVEDIREQIVKNTAVAPYLYKYKIFIIKNAHYMTAAAQNALLKTIEEPKDYCIYMLLSEYFTGFLPTVLSRCVMFKLKPLDFNIVKDYLLNSGYDENTAHLSAVFSKGSIGHGKSLCEDKGFFQLRDEIIDLIRPIRRRDDLIYAFHLASVLEKQKENIAQILDIMTMWYRDLFVLKTRGDMNLIFQTDLIEEYEKQSERYTPSDLYNILNYIYEAGESLRLNGNFNMTIGTLMSKISGF